MTKQLSKQAFVNVNVLFQEKKALKSVARRIFRQFDPSFFQTACLFSCCSFIVTKVIGLFELLN